jgi:hypothetical protein
LESNPPIYQFGEFMLDVGRACVFKAGEEIKLRPKVYEPSNTWSKILVGWSANKN